jgi:hypothetical protein
LRVFCPVAIGFLSLSQSCVTRAILVDHRSYQEEAYC